MNRERVTESEKGRKFIHLGWSFVFTKCIYDEWFRVTTTVAAKRPTNFLSSGFFHFVRPSYSDDLFLSSSQIIIRVSDAGRVQMGELPD